MGDFAQVGSLTTLHDLAPPNANLPTAAGRGALIIPVTDADRRSPAFANIVRRLAEDRSASRILVVLGATRDPADYIETQRMLVPLGGRAEVLWVDGRRVTDLCARFGDVGIDASRLGKGRAVWLALGYLLADEQLDAVALHDGDIVSYDPKIVHRLLYPVLHPQLGFEYCKAYYARVTDRMYGRVVRLLVGPYLRALERCVGSQPMLRYLQSYRYPLAGEFALSRRLALQNRIPCHWGLEIGTLAEVYENADSDRICQVDLAIDYEHKHQILDPNRADEGLIKMADEILATLMQSLTRAGVEWSGELDQPLQIAFSAEARRAIRQYQCDSLLNGLNYDADREVNAARAFEQRIPRALTSWRRGALDGQLLPSWGEVRRRCAWASDELVAAATADAEQFGEIAVSVS